MLKVPNLLMLRQQVLENLYGKVFCFSSFNSLALQDSHLTVCVTRAGAGGGTPSDWKNDKA
jgi:hypothetical protein